MEILLGNRSVIHMQNTSLKQLSYVNGSDLPDAYRDVVVTLWIIGIIASFLGLSVQTFLLILVPGARKFDEIIVTQMTFARTLYTIFEYYFSYHVVYDGRILKIAVYFLYIYSDLVSLVLMFVFTKNLYDKVVVVFPLKFYSLSVVSAIIWIAPAPVATLCPLTLSLRNGSFGIFYKVYAYVKFTVCCLNAIIFMKIIRVSFQSSDKQRNVRGFLKTALMAFVLVTVTSVQVLVTDLISYFNDNINSNILISIFCVMYSYQACAVTGIFIVIIKSKINHPIIRQLTVRFNVNLTVTAA